jgi:hypothetical protein
MGSLDHSAPEVQPSMLGEWSQTASIIRGIDIVEIESSPS